MHVSSSQSLLVLHSPQTPALQNGVVSGHSSSLTQLSSVTQRSLVQVKAHTSSQSLSVQIGSVGLYFLLAQSQYCRASEQVLVMVAQGRSSEQVVPVTLQSPGAESQVLSAQSAFCVHGCALYEH